MDELSPVQKKILAAIERAHDEGCAPTVRELADRLRMKRSTVHYHLQALRRAGYVSGEGRHRDTALTSAARAAGSAGLKTVPGASPEASPGASPKAAPAEASEDEPLAIPLVGSVAAGRPILAAESLAGELSLSSLFRRKGRLFALEVSGDSMIDDGIRDGDYAIVRQQATAVPGDIVVAMLEDGEASEATVKRYREERGAVVHEPANAAYSPMRFEGAARSRLQILGKLVGVLRKM